MKKTILAAASLMIIFSSCKKENKATPFQTRTVKHSTADSVIDPHNPLNLVDTIGLWHNRGCASAMAYVVTTGDKTETGLWNNVNNWSIENFGVTLPDRGSFDDFLADAPMLYADKIKASSLDPYVQSYLTSLISSLQDVSSYPSPDEITYMDFKNRVMTFEAKVASDVRLTTDQKTQLYVATSIYRYSMYFWWNGTSDTPWLYGTTPSGSITSAFYLKHMIVVHSDSLAWVDEDIVPIFPLNLSGIIICMSVLGVFHF